MDMSGHYDVDDENHAEAMEMARRMARHLEGHHARGMTAVAWRNGRPITVDLSQPVRLERERVWPEYVAIAALFVATYAMAINHLKL